MKKIILLTSLLISTNSFSDELHDFGAISAAVVAGKQIHIVIDATKCIASNKNNPSLTSVSFFTPNAVHVLNDHIATSLTHFTIDNVSFPGKPVYEYVKYTITADNNVNLTGQVLNSVTYTPISDKFSLNCKMDVAAKIYI